MSASQLSAGLPRDVVPVVDGLLTTLDAAMPGGIVGFYLVGSLALDDYWPGQSDIDFIAVLDAGADVSLVAAVHRAVAKAWPQVSCDGIYLRSGELGLAPGGVGTAARDGGVIHDSPDERHAVAWLTLLRHGRVLRGRVPAADWIAGDAEAARAYSRDNLETYWRPWLDRQLSGKSDRIIALLTDSALVWGCLGVSRLHAAIVTGEVVSKSAGGRHALQHFPRHRAIVEEALRLRHGQASSYYASPVRRAADLVAMMEAVIHAVP